MIRTVALTGGPSSGKTSVIESIKERFQNKYKVIIVDETASYLINMGIKPFGEDAVNILDFQKYIFKLQLAKEDSIIEASNSLHNRDILIVFDRGLLDNQAYITQEEFKYILHDLSPQYSVSDIYDRYDLVLNLVSSKDFYTTENNPARSESSDQAIELGKKTLQAWLGHNNLKIVYPKEDIKDKIKEVIHHIEKILEDPQQKRQFKYIVDIDSSNLEELDSNAKKVYIEQTYLQSDSMTEKRLRVINDNNNKIYRYSTYRTTKDNKKIKISDEKISEDIYNKLLEFKDNKKNTINKVRYYFSYRDNYYTLDIMDGYGILESNIDDQSNLSLPPFLDIIEDVTNDPNYMNINLANKNTKEYRKSLIS